MRSGKTATSMKSMGQNYVMIPPQLLPALLFDLANHPRLTHSGDRFLIKRKVTFATGEKDAYNFLFTKQDGAVQQQQEEGPEPSNTGEASSAPPPPDFNGTVLTDSSHVTPKKKKASREIVGAYKRLYTEPLFTEQGTIENKTSRSRKRTEAQMHWQICCLLAMQSAPTPKDADKESLENSVLCPVHRRAVRYEYKVVAMDKLHLTRVDRGWIALEAHLIMTEELIRNFNPLSHQIKGVHSLPRLHLTTRKAHKQARKKLKKGHAFTGGAYAHGLAVTLNVSSDASPSDVLPSVSKPKLSSDAMHAMSSTGWGQLIGLSYLHGLGTTSGRFVPWTIGGRIVHGF